MTVQELIAKLSECDPKKDVYLFNGLGSEQYIDDVVGLYIDEGYEGVEICHTCRDNVNYSLFKWKGKDI